MAVVSPDRGLGGVRPGEFRPSIEISVPEASLLLSFGEFGVGACVEVALLGSFVGGVSEYVQIFSIFLKGGVEEGLLPVASLRFLPFVGGGLASGGRVHRESVDIVFPADHVQY